MREMQAARRTPVTGRADADSHPATAGQDAPAGPAGPAGAPLRRRRVGVLIGVALFVLAVDIATKVAVVATLSNRAPIRLLGGFLKLTLSRNPGAAFSLGASFGWAATVVYSAIAIGVIILILRISQRIRSVAWAVTLGLLLGGATGNLTDRIFRGPGPFRGWVVDWIQVPHWPVFNLADSAIVCGGILAVLLSVRGIRLDGEREPR
jgi:lipoprotein signal peptidase